VADSGVVQVVGVKELRATMKKAGEDLADLKAIHQAAGNIVVAVAQQLAPKRSGALAGTIRATRQAAGVAVKAGSASVPYAGPIHWGWRARNITGNPFLTDAAAQTEEQWVSLYYAELEKIIERVEGDK
jgi:HK97 gp10 family phage protein